MNNNRYIVSNILRIKVKKMIKEAIVKILHEEDFGNGTGMMDFNHMMGDFGQGSLLGFPIMYLGMILAFVSILLIIYVLIRAVERGSSPTVIAVTTPTNTTPVTPQPAATVAPQRQVPSVPTYTCPNCGNPVPPNSQYCPTCGFKLTQG